MGGACPNYSLDYESSFDYEERDDPSHNFTSPEKEIPRFCLADPLMMLSPWIVNTEFLSIIITYSVTFVIGVIGNTVAVVGMAADRKSNSATTLFLLSLTAADLLLLTLCVPLETASYFVTHWDESGTICRLAYYLESTVAAVSVLNLSAVSIERFIVILFPMKSRSLCTLKNCRRAVILVWFISPLLSIPAYYVKYTWSANYTSPDGRISVLIHSCTTDSEQQFVQIYQVSLLFAAPAVIMIVCYAFVIKELWISTRTMSHLTNAGTNESTRKPRVTVPSIVLLANHQEIQSVNTADDGTPILVQSCASYQTIPSRGTRHCSSHVYRFMQVHLRQSGVGKRATTVRLGTAEAQHTKACQQQSTSVTHHGRPADPKKARKQVIKMLLLIIILFLIFWGPKFIMEIIRNNFDFDSFTGGVYKAKYILNLLPFVHSCINPVVYTFMSRNFRDSMRRRYRSLVARLRKDRRDSIDQSKIDLMTRSSWRRSVSTPLLVSKKRRVSETTEV